MSIKLIPRDDIKDIFDLNIIFKKDKLYEFIYVDNRYTKINGYVGYIFKDEEKQKRWLTEEFKLKYFEQSILL